MRHPRFLQTARSSRGSGALANRVLAERVLGRCAPSAQTHAFHRTARLKHKRRSTRHSGTVFIYPKGLTMWRSIRRGTLFAAAATLLFLVGNALIHTGTADENKADAALERTRKTVRMLDDVYKTTVV